LRASAVALACELGERDDDDDNNNNKDKNKGNENNASILVIVSVASVVVSKRSEWLLVVVSPAAFAYVPVERDDEARPRLVVVVVSKCSERCC